MFEGLAFRVGKQRSRVAHALVYNLQGPQVAVEAVPDLTHQKIYGPTSAPNVKTERQHQRMNQSITRPNTLVM